MNDRQSWLRNYVSKASGPWKAAVCFLFVVIILMLLNGAAVLAGWHAASSRLVAYLGLAAVGFFVSLAFHAYLSIRGSRMQKLEEHKRTEGTDH